MILERVQEHHLDMEVGAVVGGDCLRDIAIDDFIVLEEATADSDVAHPAGADAFGDADHRRDVMRIRIRVGRVRG